MYKCMAPALYYDCTGRIQSVYLFDAVEHSSFMCIAVELIAALAAILDYFDLAGI